MANYLSVEKRKRIFHLLCEGNCLRSVTRIIGCSTNTVTQLQKKYSCIVDYLNRSMISELEVNEIEVDEIATYVARKNNPRWVFIALDRKTRFIIHFHIGNRDEKDAKIFLQELSFKLNSTSKVATDMLRSYVAAVARNDYGRYEAATSNVYVLRGHEGGEYLERSITNHVERHNGTVRQHVARLIRAGRCFSKKEEGLRTHLMLFFFYYNFIKTCKAVKCPPAMAIGLTDEANWMEKILEYDMIFSENMKAVDPKKYGVYHKKPEIKSIGQAEQNQFLEQIAGVVQFVRKDKKQAKIISL
jgi:IS1 family transposase